MNPVQYSARSQMVVDRFNALPPDKQNRNYWGEDEVNPVRAEIKDHYIAEQQYSCAYCKRQIVTGNKALWDAEHIVCRDNVAGYMFVAENLAVSCRDCNIAKGRQEVRTTFRKKFPNESKHYLIVHPHFDTYEDHIRWFGAICAPVSAKGVATQVMCGLTRFTAELLGINGALVNPGFDKYIGELISAKTRVDAEAAMAALMVYVKDVPQR